MGRFTGALFAYTATQMDNEVAGLSAKVFPCSLRAQSPFTEAGMNQHKQPDKRKESPSDAALIERPGRKPELDSDAHPQRHPGTKPLPDESDNIPGDENAPNLVPGKH